MMHLLGTSIFWTSVASSAILLAAMTLVGRAWSRVFLPGHQQAARFYLAPVMGLATFVLIGSYLGRYVALGDSILVPLVVGAILVAAFRYQPAIAELKRDIALVCGFGLLCGTSVLAPLYLHGALNAHNDTFTYLAQSDWLQHSPFLARIAPDQMTPASSQIALYQIYGFRMGASFLLALAQAMLNARWALEVYPGVVIAAMAACCLLIGFPVAVLLKPLRLRYRLPLLALPSFGLGGLVFGANFGFLPQTVGLGLSAGAVFATGLVLRSITAGDRTTADVVRAVLPIATLLAAVIFSYSEIVPFVVAGIGLGGLWFAVRRRAWRAVIVFGTAVAVLTALLCNFELLRTYASLRLQAGAVVGSPVDWSVVGFAGHALGLHGGAWESWRLSVLGAIWGAALIVLLLTAFRSTRWDSFRSTAALMIPTVALLLCFGIAFMYFRYAVASPFPVGRGQSWSQFKLTDWASPSVAAMVLALLASFFSSVGPLRRGVLLGLIAAAAIGSSVMGVVRHAGVMNYYTNVDDLAEFYPSLRRAVFAKCPLASPVYLALGGSDLKFRQMAALYLADRDVRGDFEDDVYIGPHLPPDRRTTLATKGDCLVEPIRAMRQTGSGTVIGPVHISVFDGKPRAEIAAVEGAYDQENDASGWWRWVTRKVTFRFSSALTQDDAPLRLTLRFNYAKAQQEPLKLVIADGKALPVSVDVGTAQSVGTFSHDFTARSIRDVAISIGSDAEPQLLGPGDPRRATFMVKNLSVTVNQQ
jgi:hypothetical protein